MPTVEGIVGHGFSDNDIDLEIPSCVKLLTPDDHAAFKAFADTLVKATARNAAAQLRAMLAKTPNAEQLALEFAQRLGV